MTEVEFHFNVPDRLVYACRLLRKAARKRVGVAVIAPPPTLDSFDRLLWTFGDTDFVAAPAAACRCCGRRAAAASHAGLAGRRAEQAAICRCC